MMRRRSWVLLTLGIAAGLATAWIWWGWSGNTIDLIELFDDAEKKSTMEVTQAFSIVDATLAGDTRHAIFAHPVSQITWHLTLPDHPRLDVALGISEESWRLPGDGVRFRIGVQAGGSYEPLFERHLYPGVWFADRGWQPVSLDLSAFAGRKIDLVFSTNASAIGDADPRNDWSMWGSPVITRVRP